jgi:hypothetical protein
LSEARLEQVDVLTKLLMCLRELQAERDHTVAIPGSH